MTTFTSEDRQNASPPHIVDSGASYVSLPFYEIPVKSTIADKLLEFAMSAGTWNKYQCSSPQISMHIKMSSFFSEGTCVYSGNFLSLRGAQLTDAILGLYRFSKESQDKTIIPYFFLNTPELAYSFVHYRRNNNSVVKVTEQQSTYMSRVIMYNVTGFPVIPQKDKFTGFEKYKEHYDSHDYVLKDLKARLRWQNKPSHRPFDWLFRYPYEEKFGCPRITFVLNKLPYVIN